MSDLVGRRIGDYQVLRRLGSGGMADVYAARQLTLTRDVALKVMRTVTQGDEDNLKRFRREAQAAARLNHPSIVQVYEFGEVDGVHFISQELVDGINLKQALDREGPFSTEQAIEVLRSVGGALRVAHESGVTHRDIKPENIMRGQHDTIKVTDFGLARMLTQVDSSTANLTRAGLALGTPRYMSPEQIQGSKVDARSDLYSLGVTMYHLLSGSPPFDAEEALALAVKHLHETPRPLDHVRGTADLPAWLVALVMRCLQKSPDSRFDSAEDLLRFVEANTRSASVPIETTGASTEETTSTGAVTVSPELDSTVKLGISSVTLQLQRATDAARKIQTQRTHRRRLTRAALVLTCVLGVVGGSMVALASRPTSIDRELRGPVVAVADSISQQYLTALTRNDVPGWEAVLAFPVNPDGSESDYHVKAKLQLARLLIEQREYERANRWLDELRQSPSVKPLYLMLSLVHRHTIAMSTGKNPEASRLKTEIAEKLSTANTTVAEAFRRIVPESERLKLGLVD